MSHENVLFYRGIFTLRLRIPRKQEHSEAVNEDNKCSGRLYSSHVYKKDIEFSAMMDPWENSGTCCRIKCGK